jgi:hypothetical protein
MKIVKIHILFIWSARMIKRKKPGCGIGYSIGTVVLDEGGASEDLVWEICFKHDMVC